MTTETTYKEGLDRYLATREKPDKDWLPSKETCIAYTLAVCGHDTKEADQIIDNMVQGGKRFDRFIYTQEWKEFMEAIGMDAV